MNTKLGRNILCMVFTNYILIRNPRWSPLQENIKKDSVGECQAIFLETAKFNRSQMYMNCHWIINRSFIIK